MRRTLAVLPAAPASIANIARHIFKTRHSPVHHAPPTHPFTLLSAAFFRPAVSHLLIPHRSGSSSSSTRWKSRQSSDSYAKEARVAGLKSRAAFKLLEIDSKHHLFRRGDTVVDLGFAPGSWSQVAVNRAGPTGRVIGIDVIPAPPPRGANALQGNFLSEETRERVREFVREEGRGRVKGGGYRAEDEAPSGILQRRQQEDGEELAHEHAEEDGAVSVATRAGGSPPAAEEQTAEPTTPPTPTDIRTRDRQAGRVVDVVLSDMSAPWPLVTSTWVKSVNNPYLRMMNTSGMAFRDHAGSMVSLSPPFPRSSPCLFPPSQVPPPSPSPSSPVDRPPSQ